MEIVRISEAKLQRIHQAAFDNGVKTGKQQLTDHIQYQFAVGKPVEINGELYWLKDARQNLMDIMDDIATTWDEGNGTKKYIVPISITHTTSVERSEMLIKANDPKVAMMTAEINFERNGWIVDKGYHNYRWIIDRDYKTYETIMSN